MARDYEKELNSIIKKLLTIQHLDIDSFTNNFKRLVNSVYFFHNIVCKNAKSLEEMSRVQYKIPVSERPREGQIGYFHLENSYPKEIFNSHWCFIIKDFGNTMLVVPLVSIKKDKKPVDNTKEMIIKIKDFEEDGCSKLRINQIRVVDTLRLIRDKNIYDLQTDLNYVKNYIKKITFDI